MNNFKFMGGKKYSVNVKTIVDISERLKIWSTNQGKEKIVLNSEKNSRDDGR